MKNLLCFLALLFMFPFELIIKERLGILRCWFILIRSQMLVYINSVIENISQSFILENKKLLS